LDKDVRAPEKWGMRTCFVARHAPEFVLELSADRF